MVAIQRTAALAAALTALTAIGGCSTVKRTAGLEAAARRCENLSFPIYFQTGSIDLTPPAREMIRTSAQRTKGCRVSQVRVVGLADADGSAQRNMELSRQRADAVAAVLAAEGFPAPTFDLAAGGEAGSVSGRTVDPVRRRTEVQVTFAP